MQLKTILTDKATNSVCHFQEVFLDPTDCVSYLVSLTLKAYCHYGRYCTNIHRSIIQSPQGTSGV